jgi:hypothetical protein
MKTLTQYINEGNIDVNLLNDIVICVLENDQTMYEKFKAVANAIAKKGKRDERPDFEILKGSSVVQKLSKDAIDLYNKLVGSSVRLNTEERNHLKGYIAAQIFHILGEEFEGLTDDEIRQFEDNMYYSTGDMWNVLK